jgi:hypothetical protein
MMRKKVVEASDLSKYAGKNIDRSSKI